MALRWRFIILIWIMGVLAAGEFGKIAPLIPSLRDHLHLDLAQAGWLASLIELGGATCGILAGLAVAKIGLKRALRLGLILLALGGGIEAFADGMAAFCAARIVESAGYLLVVVAGPSLIAHLALPQDSAAAFGLWSTFVPVGFGLGAIVTGAALEPLGIRGTLLLWAVAAAVLTIAATMLRDPGPGKEQGAGKLVLPAANIWWLSLGFGCYALLFVGMMSLLPTFLAERLKASAATAGAIAGLASAATLAGSAAAPFLLKRMAGQGVRLALLWGLFVPAGLCFLLFSPWLTSLPAAGGIAILLNAVSGLAPAVMFARLAEHIRADPRPIAAAANGVLTQFGAGGSFMGPPVVGLIVGFAGWSGVAVAVLALSFLSFAFMVLAERTTARSFCRA